MKLALLIAFPSDPSRPHGGVEAVAVTLVEALARIPGLDVHVLTFGMAQTQNWKGATIHFLSPPESRLLSYATGAGRKRVAEFLQTLQPDVVHSHDTFGIMMEGSHFPRVFTVHGFIYEDTRYKGGLSAWLRSKLWERVEKKGWADQPHIISISPYVRERLQPITRATIHDIENPIAYECFQIKRDEQRGTIFCAATICERKNTLGLLKAFALLSKQHSAARLRWAGPVVDEAYGAKVQQFIKDNSLTDKVTLLGSIQAADVRKELARASVFALVSFEEGAPMGVAEALAAGVPVVTSNRCGMPYMVRDQESGLLIDPENPADIATALHRILSDAPLADQMSRRATATAAQMFHPDSVAARTMAVYQTALGGRH